MSSNFPFPSESFAIVMDFPVSTLSPKSLIITSTFSESSVFSYALVTRISIFFSQAA